MKTRIAFLVFASTTLVSCIPPPHPAVVAVRQSEELLPSHQRSPALRNPHLLQALELSSLLHNGESPVFEREADNVPRREIYSILTHAGFIRRQNLVNQLPEKPPNHAHGYTQSHDSPFAFNPELLQYLSHIKDYCSNCTFAGVHFVADETKHWSERWLWVGLIILAWYGSGLLIISAWKAFITNPISFGVETTYTDWNTNLPTVAICELSNDDNIYNVSDTIWTPNHLLDLEDVLKDIAYFRGVAYSLIEVCFLSKFYNPNCPLSNYSYYAELVRSSCPQILSNCSYNDEEFDCCEYFQLINTDLGNCYIINSIQTRNPKPFPMIINMKQKQGILRFMISINSMMYTLGEDEIPTVTTLHSSTLKITLGKIYRRQVTVRNIENDPLVVETTTEQRACRFHNENEDGLYPRYSYSACNILCRKQAQIKLCQCNDHFMIGAMEAERCNISGMWCLHTHSSHLTTLKPSWAQRPGLSCDCMPSCDETEITVIKDVIKSIKSKRKKYSYVEMVMTYLPTERFKRNVVRSRLDLVVSVGGTAGLFVGASLLSFVELIFFFTVRFISNVGMERRNNKIVKTEINNWIEKH